MEMTQLQVWLKTPKYRLVLLVGIWCMGIVLVYQCSFRKYLAEARKKEQLQAQKDRVDHLLQQIPDLDAALADLRQSHPASAGLTEKVTTFCEANDLQIKQFGESASFKAGEKQAHYHELEMIGAFKPMLQLAYEIEHVERQAYIPSAEWFLEKDRKTKKMELHGKLILQTLTNE